MSYNKCLICGLYFRKDRLYPIRKVNTLQKTMQVIFVCSKCKEKLIRETQNKLKKRKT